MIFALALAFRAHAMEICTYEGEASYRGHTIVRTEASMEASLLTLRVTGRLTTSPWRLWDVEYLGDEITTWRDGVLASIATNGRYLVNGAVQRQQWDVYRSGAGGLEDSRAQAKRVRDFSARYPGFAVYWPLSAFGQDWLPGFATAPPDRRPDLDLPHPSPALRTPLALAFYWVRYLPPDATAVPVFLPGFKRDALVTETVRRAGNSWTMPLRHPALGDATMAEAVVVDHHLRRFRIDAHETLGAGQATLSLVACEGSQDRP